MGLLDWLKNLNKKQVLEPDNELAISRHSTHAGNEIAIQHAWEWTSDGVGVHEMRAHVGRSVEGYHGALEISRQGGESSWTWSEAMPSVIGAEKAAIRMMDGWKRRMSPELERIERLQQETCEYRRERKVLSPDNGHSWER